MPYLLDTHALLWWVADDMRLSRRARELLRASGNEIFFSAVSAWEIAIKVQLGRPEVIEMDQDPATLIPSLLTECGFQSLSITMGHALRVAALPLLHRDPFDRLLIAQAQLEDLTILTADPAIARYDVTVAW